MKTVRGLLALGFAASLTACETYGDYGGGYGGHGNGYGFGGLGPKETMAGVIGAATGAVVGSQFGQGDGKIAMTAVGTLAGALIGASFGRSLDRADQQYATRAQYGALQSGYPTQWNNPQSGHYGYVAPGPAYYDGGGECRDYSHTVYIDGRPETLRGTACRMPDGSWRTANS